VYLVTETALTLFTYIECKERRFWLKGALMYRIVAWLELNDSGKCWRRNKVGNKKFKERKI